jgi:hypothetical protein
MLLVVAFVKLRRGRLESQHQIRAQGYAWKSLSLFQIQFKVLENAPEFGLPVYRER